MERAGPLDHLQAADRGTAAGDQWWEADREPRGARSETHPTPPRPVGSACAQVRPAGRLHGVGAAPIGGPRPLPCCLEQPPPPLLLPACWGAAVRPPVTLLPLVCCDPLSPAGCGRVLSVGGARLWVWRAAGCPGAVEGCHADGGRA